MPKLKLNNLRIEYLKWKLTFKREKSQLASSMQSEHIIPDVISKAPKALLKVCFEGGIKFTPGQEITPTQAKHSPCLFWTTQKNSLYTVCMVDPDVPSRKDPKFREYSIWLVGNIPGDEVIKGEELMQYIGVGPQEGTGYHRYVMLVFQHNGKLNFDEPRLDNRTPKGRSLFSVQDFAAKYSLGNPIAGTFFIAKWDQYVTIINKKLGFV